MPSDAGDIFVEVDVPGRDRTPVRQYSAGRVCAHPGCGAILSIYNADDECSLHLRDFSSDHALRGLHRRAERGSARRVASIDTPAHAA